MESIDEIPIKKIQRASKLVKTGAKVGLNYLKYVGDRVVNDSDTAKENLNQNNADTIYDGLKQLKGSPLKALQMLSMEGSIIPEAYVEKFSLAQFSVPPLSPALVVKTFQNYFGKAPSEIFDSFNASSKYAASIGQIHEAEKDGKKLAVKIQYPGVAESISSDLALVKPIAMQMFNIKGEGSEVYFKEVENKLCEETDYILEVSQSQKIAKACECIQGLKFPEYFPDLSTERIITMSWMEGDHISKFAQNNTDKLLSNKIGQVLWDFYMHQIHQLREVHADPHPGNFLISKDHDLIALDFGCMKAIPDSFYIPYFELVKSENINNPKRFKEKLVELEILKSSDTPAESVFFEKMFYELLCKLTLPFQQDAFDFSDPSYFESIAKMSKMYAQQSTQKRYNGNRGSKHFIYMNRTFYGLYNLLHLLKADQIQTQ